MSRRLKDKITDPKLVIPYLYDLFYNGKIKKKFFIEKIYLVGSRGRTPLKDWDKKNITHKDWDIAIQTTRRILNPNLWIDRDKYHVEILICGTESDVNRVRSNNYKGSGLGIELFPNTSDEFKKYMNNE